MPSFGGQFNQFSRQFDRMLTALNLTRTGNQSQREFVADFKFADFYLMLFHVLFLCY